MKSLVGSLLDETLFSGKAHWPSPAYCIFASQSIGTSKPITSLKEEHFEQKQEKKTASRL